MAPCTLRGKPASPRPNCSTRARSSPLLYPRGRDVSVNNAESVELIEILGASRMIAPCALILSCKASWKYAWERTKASKRPKEAPAKLFRALAESQVRVGIDERAIAMNTNWL